MINISCKNWFIFIIILNTNIGMGCVKDTFNITVVVGVWLNIFNLMPLPVCWADDGLAFYTFHCNFHIIIWRETLLMVFHFTKWPFNVVNNELPPLRYYFHNHNNNCVYGATKGIESNEYFTNNYNYYNYGYFTFGHNKTNVSEGHEPTLVVTNIF